MSDLTDTYLHISHLDFDDSHDDSFLGRSSIGKKKSTTTQTSDEDGTFTTSGRVFKDLKDVQFDELASFANGIRIMALDNADDVIPRHQELFKLRIANPVWNDTSNCYSKLKTIF